MDSKRYYVIDYIRTLLIINMILYHTIWDVSYIFYDPIEWFHGNIGHIWGQFICFGFVLLSGFCWSFGKNHLKKGSIIFLCGLLITVVTEIFIKDSVIVFGVLTFIGSAIIIMIPLSKLLKNVSCVFGLIASIALFVITFYIWSGEIFFGLINLPDWLYKGGYISTYLGFMEKGFCSTDYFPIFPWLFLYIAGYFVYRIMTERNIMSVLKGKRIKIVEFISKNSLIIYMLHQVIIYGILTIIF